MSLVVQFSWSLSVNFVNDWMYIQHTQAYQNGHRFCIVLWHRFPIALLVYPTVLDGVRQKTKTHFRQGSSRTELSERYLRYSNHLWYFLGGQLFVTSVVDVRVDCFTAPWTPHRSKTMHHNVYFKGQIPLRYLVADRFEAGRRPAASWNLANHLACQQRTSTS